MHPILFTIPLPRSELPALPGVLALGVFGLLLAGYAYWRKLAGLLVFAVALAIVAGYAASKLVDESVTLGRIAVPAWGALLGVWLIVAWSLTQRSARRQGDSPAWLGDCWVLSALWALLLARVGFVAANSARLPELELLALRQGGLLGAGALVGAVGSAAWFLRRRPLGFWRWLDSGAPVLASGLVLIRAGCYFEGCDFGARLETASPKWLRALGSFPRWGDPDVAPVFGAPAWVEQVKDGLLESEQLTAHAVHPSQLYELLLGVLLLGLCWALGPRRRFHGQLGLVVLFVYALGRFLLEPLRGDAGRGLFGPHLAAEVALPLGLLVFAAAFSYGPALSFRGSSRYAIIAASALPAGLMGIASFGQTTPASPLSAAQWLALLTALGVGYAWSVRAPHASAGAAAQH